MYLLIDCNNFYVSVEQIFRPNLKDKPVVVLSNNDGCVIARSQEAKSIGIEMGAPFFQIKPYVNLYGLTVISSNYSLYGDLSSRMNQIIESEGWPFEVYSIDETFLYIADHEVNCLEYTTRLKEKIEKWIGLSISIGCGATKTLAKAANFFAKNYTDNKICYWPKGVTPDFLAKLPVHEVFGVGKRFSKKLVLMGIDNALLLAKADYWLLRQYFPVGLSRTAAELNGIDCLSLEELAAPPKSIARSRSFGQKLYHFDQIQEALASLIEKACDAMKKKNVTAYSMTIFLRGSPYTQDADFNFSCFDQLSISSHCVFIWTKLMKKGLACLFKPGYAYSKGGIFFHDLTCDNQLDLLDERQSKQSRLSLVIDEINHKAGKQAIRIACTLGDQAWKSRSAYKSPSFTTCWDDLPEAH